MVAAVLFAVLVACLAGVGGASAKSAKSARPHSTHHPSARPAAVAPPTVTTPPAVVPAAVPGVRVQGNQLLSNGVPWVPRGVQIVGLVAPPGALTDKYIAAGAHFGQAELQKAVADHADLIRYQVSEFGIDPQGPLYSPAYVQSIQSAVQQARALGLNVIISLQAEQPAGEPTRCPLPDAGAERAWQVLAPMFASDNGVMFELYNEPGPLTTRSDWQIWLNGGTVNQGNVTCQAVGMQTIVNNIRSAGADNVIILPGLNMGTSLAGVPKVTDPASPTNPQLAYSVHYPLLTGSPALWDAAFGTFSAKAPVIVTEWNANSTTTCFPTAPQRAPLLLTYLLGKRIGVVGFAFDLPGTIISDYSSYSPTTYSGFACGVNGGGPGQVLFQQFGAQALTVGGVTTSPSWMVSATTVGSLNDVAQAQTQSVFNTARTFVTGAATSTLAALSLPSAVPTARFTNESRLAAAVQTGALPAGTQAVVYAPQHSTATPVAQQRNPSLYFQNAATVVHNAALLFIAAPAVDLATAFDPKAPKAAQASIFLNRRIAAASAKFADAYAISGPTARLGGVRYASFVYAAALQAMKTHPGIQLLAGAAGGSSGTGAANSLLPAVLSATGTTPGTASSSSLPLSTGALTSCPTCNPSAAVAIAQIGSLDGAGR
jgi:hypothetical protein